MKDQYSELMAKYFSGECTEEERIQLLEWASTAEENKALLKEYQAVWALMETPETLPFDVDVDAAWKVVETQVDPAEVQSIQSKERPLWSIRRFILRTAAVFLMALMIGYAWMEWQKEAPVQMVEIETGEEEKRSIELPDGSKVWLNENTLIRYAEGFSPRQVTLEGEAFFDVEHLEEQTFEIFSGDARTLVLGTAFNVRAYPEESMIEVMVERGKVALNPKGNAGKSVLLTAGNTGTYNKTEKAVAKETDKRVNTAAWRSQSLEFSNARVKDVIESLERYFEISIDAQNPEILNCHFTGQYQQPQIEQIMDILEFVLNIKIEKNAEGFSLSGAGCDSIQ